MRKTSQSNTNRKEIPKKLYEDRFSVMRGLGKPIPDYIIEEIRIKIREWSNKVTSLRFKDFLKDMGIPYQVFYDLMDRSPSLKQEYEWALDSIASHREIGAMTGKLTPIAIRMMPRYDPEWLENEERLAKIKRLSQVEGVAGQTIIAVIPEVPNSTLVPVMKREIEDE